MEYKEKVAILRSYKDAVELSKYYSGEYNQYKSKISNAYSQSVDGMPKSSSPHNDVSDYIAKMEEMEQHMFDQMEKAENTKLNIMTWIEGVQKVSERLVIMYHHLQGHTFGWIAEEMHFSERTINRIYKKAITHLPDPDTENWL